MNWNTKQRSFFDKPFHQYDPKLILNPPRHTKNEIATILDKIKSTQKGVIVDFGSGNGRLTIPLLKDGYKILAVDLSRKSLERLRNLVGSLNLAVQTATAIPKNSKYNAIVGADILHHVDLDLWLPKLKAHLKKGGKIVFSEPNGFNPFWYPLVFLIGWETEKRIVHCALPNLSVKLKKYGYSNIKITGLGLFPRPLFNWSEKLLNLNDRLGNLPILKSFAYRLIIEAD